jgi:hypothetical protein
MSLGALKRNAPKVVRPRGRHFKARKERTSMPSNNHHKEPVGVNLDEADRRVLIAACCVQLFNLGFKGDIGHWRSRAADWDFYELLHRAQELGVALKRGNQDYALPEEITRGHWLMSRMLWNARVILTGANGQSGTIDLSANNLVTIREIEAFLAKATKMAQTLQQQHHEEHEPGRQGWKPQVVNE